MKWYILNLWLFIPFWSRKVGDSITPSRLIAFKICFVQNRLFVWVSVDAKLWRRAKGHPDFYSKWRLSFPFLSWQVICTWWLENNSIFSGSCSVIFSHTNERSTAILSLLHFGKTTTQKNKTRVNL